MRILITAGPTREFFDTVRFVSNASTGRMGYRVAQAAVARGHQVILVSGPVELPPPDGVELVRVTSAQEMFDACVARFDACDAAIMTAAVCDYRPVRRLDHKIRKEDLGVSLELEPTRDICAHLGSIKGRRVVIGFALEDHDAMVHAEQKLRRKNCNAIVLNSLGNIGGDDGEVRFLVAGAGWTDALQGTKLQIAERIVALAEELE